MRRLSWLLACLSPLPFAVWLWAAPRKPVYLGAQACGACHDGAGMGHQFTKWLQSKHARAQAVLSLPESREIARISGIRQDPAQALICLGCHAVAADAEPWEREETFRMGDGMQCEGCHGPGSEYANLEIMRDKKAAMAAGLRMPGRDDCMVCHMEKGSHMKVLKTAPFDYEKARAAIAHPAPASAAPGNAPIEALMDRTKAAGALWARELKARAAAAPRPEPVYKNPLRLALRPGSQELWVTFENSNQVGIVDLRARKLTAQIALGQAPTGICFTPDGRFTYVTARMDDAVALLDASTRTVLRTAATGDEPHGVVLDRAARHLYVLNTASDDISVFDAATLRRIKTLRASNGPWSGALAPDGSRLVLTNTYSHDAGLRRPLASEVTVISTGEARVEERWPVEGANLMAGIAWHPSGEFALATLNRTKSMAPMTQLIQGWTITNGLAVLWADGQVDQLLLDEPNRGFPDATDVAITPDGSRALVTSSGDDRVAALDLSRLRSVLAQASPEQRAKVLPNHLGQAIRFVTHSIPVGRSPRGIAVAADGKSAYVANSLDDTLSVIDLDSMRPAGVIDLAGPRTISQTRRGERLFHNASVAFRKQFSCHSCHPDGHVDRITYDIEADGIGISPVDNRTLRGILDTAPFKWEGTNPSLQRQCGARLAVFFTRALPFSRQQLDDLDAYITTIPRPQNRYRKPGTKLSPAQQRGRAIFNRTATNDGREIPPEGRCVTCHPAPYYTNRSRFDVGTRQASDRQASFDVPHLNNIYDSAPYLHNGMARTLEEIWTLFNPYDKHGFTNDMTKDQLNDLIEYLKTL